MKNNNEEISILELIEEHYNTKDGEESKFSWDYLHEIAQELLTEDNELTDKGKAEAEQHSFEHSAYRFILMLLKREGKANLERRASQLDERGELEPEKPLDRNINFERQIREWYEKGKFDLEKLLKDKNINRLALAYKEHKEEIPIEELIRFNPGSEYTEMLLKKKKEEESVLNLESEEAAHVVNPKKEEWEEKVFQKKTTFAHALFENNAAKEDILYFFGKLDEVSQKNPDFIQNYLSLSDENGKSITAILQERSFNRNYFNIFSDIKRLYPSLYPAQNNINTIEVDTHTESVHGSVDESIVRLAKVYHPDSTTSDNDRVIHINRDQHWEQKIANDILELEKRLRILTESEEDLKALIDNTKATEEDTDYLCKNFKFQAETALRMVQGLKAGGYGNHYHVNANEPVTCGLSPKEIVAIGYASLKDREFWGNPEQHDQQFMYFIENLYISKRGYNIDQHGDDEWREYGEEPDYNKCLGGTINQIVAGLLDNILVLLKIKNADIMLPILFKRLKGDVLKNIYEKEDNRNFIVNWLKGELLSNNLRDEILNILRNDEKFNEEFSKSEINTLAPQALNKISKSQLEEIKDKSFSEIFTNATGDNNSFDLSKVNDFAFDNEEGYILALEKLYNTNQEEFLKTIKIMLRTDLNEIHVNSIGARKTNCIINLLLASRNKGMKDVVQEALQEHMKGFSQDQKDQYLILITQADNVYMLMPLIESEKNVNMTDSRRGHEGVNALMYAAINNSIKVIKALIKARADINAKDHKGGTALHHAARFNNVEAISELIKLRAEIDAQDKEGNTAVNKAAASNSIEAIRALIKLGADIKITDIYGITPLHHAARFNNVEAISALIKLGADINAKDNAGDTVLHRAAKFNNVEAISALIELGADINAQDNEGNTAVNKAAASNSIEAIRALIKLGADVNIPDIHGITPLHHAALSNRKELTTALISAGAAIEADNYGWTPLRIALNCQNTEAANILRGFLSLPDFKTRIMSSLNSKYPDIDFKTRIMSRLNIISPDVMNLSREISVLDEDIQLELVKRLKSEIMLLESSDLSCNISKIISYFPAEVRFEYFKGIVIDSMKKMDVVKIQKMLQPFKGEEKIELYNIWSKYKKENTHVTRVEEGKQVNQDDIEITTR